MKHASYCNKRDYPAIRRVICATAGAVKKSGTGLEKDATSD
jgi:hypothetical protein